MKRFLAPIMLVMAIVLLWPATATAQDIVIVTGEITESTVWDNDNTYVLSGAVFVRAPATLAIEPGTLIVGEFATTGTLIIDRGAKIMAIGTQQRPIVFTSDQPEGSRERGSWGGLIINGDAPINPGLQAEGEGDTGLYGGVTSDDSSGILRYVRVEFAGIEFSPDNELNGIAFQGVGSGTVLEFLQVHMNLDDGIEFFGGTANGRYFVITWCGDDSLDWTDGWVGNVQYVVIQQRGDDADQGIEADNNGENNNKEPRSAPTLYNLTIIGAPGSVEGDESDIGILVREGTAATIRNVLVLGFKEFGIVINDPATWRQARSGDLTVANSMFWNNGVDWSNTADTGEPATTATAMSGAAPYNGFTDNNIRNPRLRRPYDVDGNFDPRPRRPSVALEENGATPATPPTGQTTIQYAPFYGAMGPLPGDNWLRNWTAYPSS